MASEGPAPSVPDMRDQELRSEALNQAVRYATGPGITQSSTDGVVNAAKAFYDFLKGSE